MQCKVAGCFQFADFQFIAINIAMFAQAITQLDTILSYVEHIDVVSTDELGINLTYQLSKKKKSEIFRGNSSKKMRLCLHYFFLHPFKIDFFLKENSVENQLIFNI